MRRGFIYAVVSVMFFGSCRAEQDDIMASFEKALVKPDITACYDASVPIFNRMRDEGYLVNTQKPNELLTRVADLVLDKRIISEDPNKDGKRLDSMENFMWQIVYCDAIARTNVYFLKLADYLGSETVIPTNNLLEEVQLARDKDKALVDSGAIKLEPIFVARYPRTPNLRMFFEKYHRIQSWNSDVKSHRKTVAWIFSNRLGQYLRSLKKEDAEAFRKLFTERAKLSKKEESLFFPEKREEGK